MKMLAVKKTLSLFILTGSYFFTTSIAIVRLLRTIALALIHFIKMNRYQVRICAEVILGLTVTGNNLITR